jgi:hypothetical protein
MSKHAPKPEEEIQHTVKLFTPLESPAIHGGDNIN